MALFGSGVERFQTASLVLHHALVILDTGDLQSIAVVRHERQKRKREGLHLIALSPGSAMPKFGRLRYVRFVSPDRGRMSSKYPCKNTWYYASHDMLYRNAAS